MSLYHLTTKNGYRAAVVARDGHEARLMAFAKCKDGWWYAGDAEFIVECPGRTCASLLAVETP